VWLTAAVGASLEQPQTRAPMKLKKATALQDRARAM